jgi:hypothetical protein
MVHGAPKGDCEKPSQDAAGVEATETTIAIDKNTKHLKRQTKTTTYSLNQG